MKKMDSEVLANIVCIRSKRRPDDKPAISYKDFDERFRLVRSEQLPNSMVKVKVHHYNDENKQVQVLLPRMPGCDRSGKRFFLSCATQECAEGWSTIINLLNKTEGSKNSFLKRYRVVYKGFRLEVIDALKDDYDKNTEILLSIPTDDSNEKHVFFGFDRKLDAYELTANLNKKLRRTRGQNHS